MAERVLKYVGCSCGCKTLEVVTTSRVDALDFNVRAGAQSIAIAYNIIPLVRCIVCDRLQIPATSMAGQSMLDPRVESYRELMEDVKIHNERVDKLEAVLGRYYRDTTEIKNDICALEETVDHLRLNVSAPVQACVTEETVENVKASKRGRKVSKTPVS